MSPGQSNVQLYSPCHKVPEPLESTPTTFWGGERTPLELIQWCIFVDVHWSGLNLVANIYNGETRNTNMLTSLQSQKYLFSKEGYFSSWRVCVCVSSATEHFIPTVTQSVQVFLPSLPCSFRTIVNSSGFAAHTDLKKRNTTVNVVSVVITDVTW